MRAVHKFLNGRFVQRVLSGRVAQLVCYLAAVSVLCIGLWILPAWVHSSRDWVLAVLILATVSLLLATLGSLSGLAEALKRGKIE